MDDNEYPAYLKGQSLDDLLSIRDSLDGRARPVRYAMVLAEIATREKSPATVPATSIDNVDLEYCKWVKPLLIVARGFAIFVAAAGFLFGQAFFGIFSIVATITGVSGVLAGGLSWLPSRNLFLKLTVTFCCLAALVGVGMDAYTFYTKYDCPGNSNGWSLKIPFIGSLLFIGYSTWTASSKHQNVITPARLNEEGQ